MMTRYSGRALVSKFILSEDSGTPTERWRPRRLAWLRLAASLTILENVAGNEATFWAYQANVADLAALAARRSQASRRGRQRSVKAASPQIHTGSPVHRHLR